MSKERIHTDAAPAAVGPYSQANALGNLVFTSGQIPLNVAGEVEGQDIGEQSHRVMLNLKAVLEAAGSSLEKVLKTTCYLSDIQSFAEFNAVYAAYFKEPFPARSCFAVKDLPKGVLVEVEAIAYR
ncbi:RidA family protein [Candidatus Haliotispira prima]|uniref:RidA family protein n=1 Tax=Candidatus Haliotispira prima TaxID=3034016 RepID=A0ABY8MEA8_9SPIO|nr:RidA family protein [Candidatus Haliotispira prima]